jgi:hypothetical protein
MHNTSGELIMKKLILGLLILGSFSCFSIDELCKTVPKQLSCEITQETDTEVKAQLDKALKNIVLACLRKQIIEKGNTDGFIDGIDLGYPGDCENTSYEQADQKPRNWDNY